MTHQRSLTALPSSGLNLILFEQKKKKHSRNEKKGWVCFSQACRKKNLARKNPIVVTTLDCHHMRSRFKEKKTDFWAHLRNFLL